MLNAEGQELHTCREVLELSQSTSTQAALLNLAVPPELT